MGCSRTLLRVVEGEGIRDSNAVLDGDTAVLEQLIDDVSAAITALSDVSPWYWALLGIRRHLIESLIPAEPEEASAVPLPA